MLGSLLSLIRNLLGLKPSEKPYTRSQSITSADLTDLEIERLWRNVAKVLRVTLDDEDTHNYFIEFFILYFRHDVREPLSERGTLMPADHLAGIGEHPRAKLAQEFYESLSLRGREIGSFKVEKALYRRMNNAVMNYRDIENVIAIMGATTPVRLRRSDTPCGQSQSFADNWLPAVGAPLLPLPGCSFECDCLCFWEKDFMGEASQGEQNP